MPAPPPARLDVATAGRAASAVAGRTSVGVLIGAAAGVLVFVVLRALGLLDARGWGDAVVWLALLPLYVVAGSTALGFVGLVGGLRRAATLLLVDSGVIDRVVTRALARAKTGEAGAGVAGDPELADGMPRRVAALGRRIAEPLYRRALANAAAAEDTVPQVEDAARQLVDSWGEVSVALALLALAAGFALAPIAIALW